MNVEEMILPDSWYASKMETLVVPFTKELEKDGYFTSFDDAKIYYRTYRQQSARCGVVICHGFTEDSEKYRELIYYFIKCGLNVYIFDLRDHGYSARMTESNTKVYIDSFDTYVKDYECFIGQIVKPFGDEKLYAYAHSMGGGVTASYMIKNPTAFDKAVLSTPMIRMRTYVPDFVMKPFVWFMTAIGKDKARIPFSYKGFPKEERFDLVSNGSRIRYSYYHRICLGDSHYQSFSGTVGWVRECVKASKLLCNPESVAGIETPLLVFKVKKDIRVSNREIERFCVNAKNAKLQTVEGKLRHEIYTADENILKGYIHTIADFFEM